MIIKDLIDEDFVNYKLPSMVISFPRCNFKCGKVCQNSKLAQMPDIEVDPNYIVKRYINNKYTESIVFSGLDAIDTFDSTIRLIEEFRMYTDDDIVIYTGYNKNEISSKIERLKEYKNIIIKFGRYISGQEKHFDELLGVELASDNQYAEKIS